MTSERLIRAGTRPMPIQQEQRWQAFIMNMPELYGGFPIRQGRICGPGLADRRIRRV